MNKTIGIQGRRQPGGTTQVVVQVPEEKGGGAGRESQAGRSEDMGSHANLLFLS